VLDSRVNGQSMGASLPPGTPIRILLSEAARVGPGDVVAFVSGRRIVVHRLVARGRRGAARGYWITRGDAEVLPDPPVGLEAVLGPVRQVSVDGRDAPVPDGPAPGATARLAVAFTRAMADLSVSGTRRLVVSVVRLRAAIRGGSSRAEAAPLA
jgi:hypothetical protein